MTIIFKVDSEHQIVGFYKSFDEAEQYQDNHYDFFEKDIPMASDEELMEYLNKDIRTI